MILVYLTYFQLFASMFTSILLFFFPGLVTYKQLAQLIAIISAFTIVYYLFTFKKEFKSFFVICLVLSILILSYYYTPDLYTEESAKYDSFKLVLIGQTAPTMLCAVIVSHSMLVQNKIKKIVPIIALVFTIIAFYSVFFPSSQTSVGLALDDSGLSYHTSSYLAAYAAAFAGYYIVCFNKVKWSFFFRHSFFILIMFFVIIINLITIFVSGGRGGLMLFAFQLCFFVYLLGKKYKGVIRILNMCLFILFVLLLLPTIVSYAESVEVETSGFSRIVEFLEKGDDSGRDLLRAAAIDSFWDNPVFGHGVGSVFFELGFYSHNCITDMMVEIGIVGVFIMIAIFWRAIVDSLKDINLDISNSLWFIICLDGLIVSLFSGYYLAQIPLWWFASFYYSRLLSN